MYLLFWAMPLLFAVGLLSGAFRATRVVLVAALPVVALTAWVAIDGHASIARSDYCDTGFDCPNVNQAVFLGALTLAVLLLPHGLMRGMRYGIERRSGRTESVGGDAQAPDGGAVPAGLD